MLRVYAVYTVIAEKYQAMVILGQAKSRMKDFFDLAVIARRTELDGATLAADRPPTERPFARTKQFSEDAVKLRQWHAFLRLRRKKLRNPRQTTFPWLSRFLGTLGTPDHLGTHRREITIDRARLDLPTYLTLVVQGDRLRCIFSFFIDK